MNRSKNQSVFGFKSYRDYLLTRFSIKGPTRGLRTQWANEIRTQPAFVTQVLNGKMDLGPEHIPPTNKFLGHSKEESHFFTLLVLYERAATRDLKNYYEELIADILEKRIEARKNTHENNVLSLHDKSIYYSQWYYSAIRLLVSVPKYQTRAAISERLRLSPAIVSAAVDALLKMGLVSENNGILTSSEKHITLAKDSPYRTQLHANLRNRTLVSLTDPDPRDYHSSFALTFSFESYEKLRKSLVDFIEENKSMLRESKEEEAFVFTIDLFKLV